MRIIIKASSHPNSVLNAFLNSRDSFISLSVPLLDYDSCSFKTMPK